MTSPDGPLDLPRKTRGDAINLREYERDLAKWLDADGLTYAQACVRLEEAHGVKVSQKVLWRWYRKHSAQQLRQTILRSISSAAQATRQIRDHAARYGIPENGELVGYLRVIAHNLATRPDAHVNTEQITGLLRPVLEFAKIEQNARKLDLDARRLELLERKAAEAQQTIGDGTLTEEQKMARFREIFGLQNPTPAAPAAP